MIIPTNHAQITSELMGEENKPVQWHFVKFDKDNNRHQLEVLGWHKLSGDGAITRINKNLIAFTDETTAGKFLEFIDTPEFRALPETLWDDADDFNDAVASSNGINLAGNIPVAGNMLDITNAGIVKEVVELWLYMYVTCGGRVWHHSDRFWFENKTDMLLLKAFLNDVDLATWETNAKKRHNPSNEIDIGDLLDRIRVNPPFVPPTQIPQNPPWGNPRPMWYYNETNLPDTSIAYVTTTSGSFDTSALSNDISKTMVRNHIIQGYGGEDKLEELFDKDENAA